MHDLAELADHLERTDDTTWMEHAECRGTSPALFHPERGASLAAARDACNSCPVRMSCLAHAIVNNESRGVWGGCSERERKALRHQLNMPVRAPVVVCGTVGGHTAPLRRGEDVCDECRVAYNTYRAQWRARRLGAAVPNGQPSSFYVRAS